MKKQKKNNVDYWLSLNCDPQLCSVSNSLSMALLRLLFLRPRRPKLHCLQFHREHWQHNQTTGTKNNSDERCYSEQVHKQSRRDFSKERTCWKARAWNDWHQKQLNKFLTLLSWNEANDYKSFEKCHGRYINKPSSSIRAFLHFPRHLDS